MIDKYSPVSYQGNYWIKRLYCKCKDCNAEFSVDTADEHVLVKFIEEKGTEVRWLPLMGENGYLQLLCKVITGRQLLDPVDMKIVKRFEKEMDKILQKSILGNKFLLDTGKRRCPICNSREVSVTKEELVMNPELKWMQIKDN